MRTVLGPAKLSLFAARSCGVHSDQDSGMWGGEVYHRGRTRLFETKTVDSGFSR